MKNDLHPIEEYELLRATGSIYDAVQVSVTDKNLTFTSHHHESPATRWNGKYVHKTQVIFKKKCNSRKDSLEIEFKAWSRRKREQVCNLGHVHSSEEYDWDDWQRMNFTWEDFARLLEWFQNGRFYDARTKQAKARKASGGIHSKERLG